MSNAVIEFAASSNGDRWLLSGDDPITAEFVIHQANPASGGRETAIPVKAFLEIDIGSPQHSALIDVLSSALGHTGGLVAAPAKRKTKIEDERLPTYEDGMQIIWDVVTREIVVIFRGKVITLPQRFDSREDGIAAGEQACRNAGWGCE